MDRNVTLWTPSFTLLCAAHFILNVAFYLTMPTFPLFLGQTFHLEGIAMGVGVASYTASAIVTRPPTGYCIDRYGRKRIYLVGYGLFALTYLCYPLFDHAFPVILTRFVHGALWGVTMGAANTVAVDLLPDERRGEGIGYFGLGMILGMAAGPGLGLSIVATWGFGVLFATAAAMTAFGFFFLLGVRFPAVPPSGRALSLSSLIEASALPASVTVFLFCIPYGAVMNYTALLATDLGTVSAGTFFLFFAGGTLVARLCAGRIYDRSGPRTLMHLAFSLLVCGALSMALARGPWLFNGAGALLGSGYGVAVPVMQAMVNARIPAERRGAANATFMTAFDLGICIGLILTGFVHSRMGWSATYLWLAACMALSAAYFRFNVMARNRV